MWINGDRLKLAKLTASDELDRLWPERVVRMQSNRGFTQALLEQHSAAAARRQLSNLSLSLSLTLTLSPTLTLTLSLTSLGAR